MKTQTTKKDKQKLRLIDYGHNKYIKVKDVKLGPGETEDITFNGPITRWNKPIDMQFRSISGYKNLPLHYFGSPYWRVNKHQRKLRSGAWKYYYPIPFNSLGFYQTMIAFYDNKDTLLGPQALDEARKTFNCLKDCFMYLHTEVAFDKNAKARISHSDIILPQQLNLDSTLEGFGYGNELHGEYYKYLTLAPEQPQNALGNVNKIPVGLENDFKLLFGNGFSKIGAVIQYAMGPQENGLLPAVEFFVPAEKPRIHYPYNSGALSISYGQDMDNKKRVKIGVGLIHRLPGAPGGGVDTVFSGYVPSYLLENAKDFTFRMPE